jgi:DNA-binding MarR family transcriptional regulator
VATNGETANTGLRAKEKVLVQLGEHRTEPDQSPLPFEITQKGLSDHLGLRRSHVAMALQDLAKEGMVTAHKGHIEGEERRQNAYILTEAGAKKAREIRDRLVERFVKCEGTDGMDTRRIGDILESRKVSLSSVMFQLDRVGAVRDEITIVAQSTRRLIPVFCPTCQKQIEVENLFGDEEVGFDCPGCGRPYRIAPVLEKTAPGRRGTPPWMYLLVAACAVACTYLMAFFDSLCIGALAAVVVTVIIVGVLAVSSSHAGKSMRTPVPVATPVGTLVFAFLFGLLLLVSWHLFVIDIDPVEEAGLVIPLLAGITFGYYGMTLSASHLRGEFLLTVGLLLALVAATIMFTEDFGEFRVSTAPFLGISGGALLGLTKFEDLDGNEKKLGAAFASGAYLLLLTPAVILGECESAGDFLAAGALVSIGVFLMSLRIAQTKVENHQLGELLAAAVPLVAAFGLAMMATILILGDAVVAGVFELAVMLPFGYLGVRRVFDDLWMYKLPMAAFLSGAMLLVTALALQT